MWEQEAGLQVARDHPRVSRYRKIVNDRLDALDVDVRIRSACS